MGEYHLIQNILYIGKQDFYPQFETPSINYYGARYYWDKGSFWLSVDPMSDKYPNLTSYNYCANNPIMLIDPGGREIDPASEGKAVNQFNDAHSNIKSEVSKYNNKINKKMEKWAKSGYKSDSKYAKQITKLNEARSELMDLKNSFDEVVNSDVSFYLQTKENPNGNMSAGRSTIFNTEKNRVDMSFASGVLGSIVHEIRHGYGFLLGEWGWDANKNEPTSYDYQDEFNAISNRNIYDFTFGNSRNFKSNNDIRNEVERGYDNLDFIDKKFKQICVPKR